MARVFLCLFLFISSIQAFSTHSVITPVSIPEIEISIPSEDGQTDSVSLPLRCLRQAQATLRECQQRFNLLAYLKVSLSRVEIKNRRLAHLIARVIPAQCPFERDISLFGKEFHIPPMCKLNPFYDELVALRFKALEYLSDVLKEDISQYF